MTAAISSRYLGSGQLSLFNSGAFVKKCPPMRLVVRSVLSGFAVVGFCAMLMGACADASEGDRCEFDNGNNDCTNGLICVQGQNICCPEDRSLATTPGCTQQPSPAGEAGIPAEASAADVTVITDSASDSETSTTVTDSGSDASDANDDGG
jgi:hypothetical protein